MSLRTQTIQGVFWSAIRNWGSSAIAAIVLIVLVRLLPREAFGLIAIATAIIAILDVSLKQGFAQALIQRAELEPEHLDTAFWVGIVLGILLTGINFAMSSVVAALFHMPDLTDILRWLSPVFLIGALSNTQQAILKRDLTFKTLAVRSLIATSMGGLVAIVMAIKGMGVWSLVGQTLTSGIIGTIILWGSTDWRPGLNVSWRHLRELFSFGFFALSADFMQIINRHADRLIMGLFLDARLVGVYDVAKKLIEIITQTISQSVAAVTFPAFSRLQHHPEQLLHAWYTACRLTSLIAFPALVGMFVIAPEFVNCVLGTRWVEAIPIIRIFSLIGLLQTVMYYNGSILLALGKPSWRLAIFLVNNILNLIAVLLVVQWGIVPVAVVTVARAYLLTPLGLMAIRKLLHFEIGHFFRQLLPTSVSAVVMMGSVALVKWLSADTLDLPLLLGVTILVGGVVYIFTVRLCSLALYRESLEVFRMAIPIGKNIK